jgi:hypothetical protein
MPVHYNKSEAKLRPAFLGDPAQLCGHRDNLVNTRQDRPGYAERFAARAKQGSPAKRATPRKPGPTHRAKGTTREQWIRIMEGR